MTEGVYFQEKIVLSFHAHENTSHQHSSPYFTLRYLQLAYRELLHVAINYCYVRLLKVSGAEKDLERE
jgi:hypothetical protein